MRIFLHAILTAVSAVLLLAAVITLFKLQPQTPAEVQSKSNWQITAVSLYTLAMCVACNVLMQAETYEVFMATAAFAAVLVVFMANTTSVILQPNE